MDWLTFIAEIVKALAWPTMVFVVLLTFRGTVTSLLPKLRIFRYGDFELRFTEDLAAAEQRLVEAGLPTVTQLKTPSSAAADRDAFIDYITRLASTSPRAAIAEAWRRIDETMRHMAGNLGLPSGLPVSRLAVHLRVSGSLPPQTVELLHQLRVLRNQAVHSSEFEPTPSQAIDYGRLVDSLVQALEAVAESSKSTGNPDGSASTASHDRS